MTPLIDVTFCVVDLETTGGSPVDDGICEIGAVKVRGGARVGTFHTLVDPGRDVPTFITDVTGLTTAMVRPAPSIDHVLPSLLEFLGDAVFVAHNERFDRSFLDAVLVRSGRPPLSNPVVDTCGLARRLVRDEVPDCKLGTLAARLRLDHRPTHRALDDALATVDLLHVLLERAAGFGVRALDDLLELPRAAAHPQAAKLALTDRLPRAPGVYVFRDAGGRVLYVGKATDLRTRVRGHFSSDGRREVGGLLRQTAAIDHLRTSSTLEAAVTEVRLIHEHLPRYNRQGTTWRKAAYLKLTDEAFPRLSVVKQARDDGATYLGPLSSSRVARQVAEAVHSALPLRRCSADAANADDVRRALTDRPDLVLVPLLERIRTLSTDGRDEEAADVRDRTAAFADAHRRVRRFQRLRRAGRLIVHFDDRRAVLDRGRLLACEPIDTPSLLAPEPPRDPSASCVVAPDEADELTVVATWLDRNAARIRVEAVDGELSSPLPRLPELRRRGTMREVSPRVRPTP